MTKLCENETYSDHGPECPKCGFTFTPDDPIYYNESQYLEDECPECETKFRVEVNHSVSWVCWIVEPSEPETAVTLHDGKQP